MATAKRTTALKKAATKVKKTTGSSLPYATRTSVAVANTAKKVATGSKVKKPIASATGSKVKKPIVSRPSAVKKPITPARNSSAMNKTSAPIASSFASRRTGAVAIAGGRATTSVGSTKKSTTGTKTSAVRGTTRVSTAKKKIY